MMKFMCFFVLGVSLAATAAISASVQDELQAKLSAATAEEDDDANAACIDTPLAETLNGDGNLDAVLSEDDEDIGEEAISSADLVSKENPEQSGKGDGDDALIALAGTAGDDPTVDPKFDWCADRVHFCRRGTCFRYGRAYKCCNGWFCRNSGKCYSKRVWCCSHRGRFGSAKWACKFRYRCCAGSADIGGLCCPLGTCSINPLTGHAHC